MAKKTKGKKATVKKAGQQPSTKAAVKNTVTDQKEGKASRTPGPALQELKRQIKETWPAAKNLADAKREELVTLVERGDAELFKDYHATWAKRAKWRRDAWLKGDSKSAEAARAKQGS